LKRAKLEDWVDEHFELFFHPTVVGCFVKVSFKGSYKLAEIVDAKEADDQPGGSTYDLGKKKTNI
jgi:hypothetical protein